jgi:UDP-2,3-diacylglucosamine hydrolase
MDGAGWTGALGIIAGGGELPGRLAETCRQTGRPVVLLALEGHAEPDRLPESPAVTWVRIGAAGAILDALRQGAVSDVVLAGRVRRPALHELRPDWKGAQILARIGARALGDDGLLRAVASVLAEEGFRVVGAHDILGELLMPDGPLTRTVPDPAAWRDIALAARVARLLGQADVGQAVVVQGGLVLGVEAIEGTDALISRCAGLKRSGPGPILVKLRKPQQDRRLDLPSFGSVTIANAAQAGFRGIAAEAFGSLCLDRAAVIAAANAAGLFVVGIDHDDVDSE